MEEEEEKDNVDGSNWVGFPLWLSRRQILLPPQAGETAPLYLSTCMHVWSGALLLNWVLVGAHKHGTII